MDPAPRSLTPLLVSLPRTVACLLCFGVTSLCFSLHVSTTVACTYGSTYGSTVLTGNLYDYSPSYYSTGTHLYQDLLDSKVQQQAVFVFCGQLVDELSSAWCYDEAVQPGGRPALALSEHAGQLVGVKAGLGELLGQEQEGKKSYKESNIWRGVNLLYIC